MTPAEPTAFRLLESIRFAPGDGFALLDAHLARMAASARHFGFAFNADAACARLAAAVEGRRAAAKVRLLLGRDGGVEVDPQPLPAAGGPVRVRVAREPVDSREPLLFHKTSDRGIYARRLAEHPGCDDVLLVNERGELTESSIANLVVALDGVRWTPPVEAGLLPGVLRAALLRGGVIRERALRPADLLRADGVYLINSVRLWRPVTVLP